MSKDGNNTQNLDRIILEGSIFYILRKEISLKRNISCL